MDISKQLKVVIGEQLGVDEDEVLESSKLVDDLGADSLDIVELIIAIEEEFEVEIKDDVVEELITVSDIIKYLEVN